MRNKYFHLEEKIDYGQQIQLYNTALCFLTKIRKKGEFKISQNAERVCNSLPFTPSDQNLLWAVDFQSQDISVCMEVLSSSEFLLNLNQGGFF